MTTLHAPTFIPVEMCSSVGLAPSTPVDQCLAAVKADVAKGGVAAPSADVAGLQKIVASAQQHGIDLKVVVMESSPPIDTPLRDLATEIGHANPGSTVLVLSPGWAGTYSSTYDRAILESGQDVAKTAPNPVVGTQAFADQLQTPDFPWMGLTITLVIGVAVAAVLTRVLQLRAGRSQNTDTAAEQGK
ncbi:Rv1476 family membrane protein [Mycolicibacterium sp. Dal123E01]|uniref:Rv1476 family membrane protein n=1 Tax=Mycolicibacterium sp. Dal123E01 TaxID=3457578 RepID=UPI00403EB484